MPTLAALRTEPTPITRVQKITGWIIILTSATKVSPIHFSFDGEVGGDEADDDAEDHRDDHGDVEVVGPVALDRRLLGLAVLLMCPPGLRVGAAAGRAVCPGPHPARAVTAVTLSFVVFTAPGATPAAWGTMRAMTRRMTRRGGREPGRPADPACSRCSWCWCWCVTAVALATVDARRDTRASARDEAVAVALSVADSPTVREALAATDPSARLQPYAEEVRADTDVDFVVVMDLDRRRFTHPDPARIGERFVGDLGGAPQGRVFTQEYAGTLGPSIRSVRARRATAAASSRWSRSASR